MEDSVWTHVIVISAANLLLLVAILIRKDGEIERFCQVFKFSQLFGNRSLVFTYFILAICCIGVLLVS